MTTIHEIIGADNGDHLIVESSNQSRQVIHMSGTFGGAILQIGWFTSKDEYVYLDELYTSNAATEYIIGRGGTLAVKVAGASGSTDVLVEVHGA